MGLIAQFGVASLKGIRERNEDFARIVTPEGDAAHTHGSLLVLADGVSGGSHGKEAAEASVRNLCADYYATPETWEVPYALDKVLTAINRWLYGQAASRRDWGGMATTLTAFVLRRRRFWLAHVGDSRAYIWRNHTLEQLTSDHVWENPEMSHVLRRAVGLDQHLNVDYRDGELCVGDHLVLLCDGVWETLGDAGIEQIMCRGEDCQTLANLFVERALAEGSRDNVTAVVAKIEALPAEDANSLVDDLVDLPVPKRLGPGDSLDRYMITQLVHESRNSIIYQAREPQSGQMVAIKTLPALLAQDRQAAAQLLQEEWLARRVHSHYFPQVVQVYPRERSYLYYAMSWHDGMTLQQKIDSGGHFTPAEMAQMAIRLCKGYSALHRLHVIHRDIKPANIHLAHDGKLRILDLGVAAAGVDGNQPTGPGTPSFMAPELFQGEVASFQSDIYALGVTLYYVLTRKYPYGEVEPFQRPRFGEPVVPSRYRPDVPVWLENILLKAVARKCEHRFETMDEMRLALERGDARPLEAPRAAPLIESNPLVLWQAIALLSLLLNGLMLLLILS